MQQGTLLMFQKENLKRINQEKRENMAYKQPNPKIKKDVNKHTPMRIASNVFSMTYGKEPTEKELDDMIDV